MYFFIILFLLFLSFNIDAEKAENRKNSHQDQQIQQISAESLKALVDIGTDLLVLNATKGGGYLVSTGGRKKGKPPPPELSCNAQEKSMCETGTRMCQRRENASEFECICRQGFAGRFCQFSLFPRTCADAFAFHEDEDALRDTVDVESGVWQLDVDGSAPLSATHAECKLDGAVTVVANNVPPEGIAIRANGAGPADAQSVFLPISYKLFSPAHLSALIGRSEHCRQTIRFDCEQSPLNFKGNRTWLEVVSREGQQQRQIGTNQPFSCACRNKELYGCGRDHPDLACYCDDLTQAGPAVDQAVLRNASAGVSAAYFRRTESTGKTQLQNFSLGPLECQGEAGTSPGVQVTLRTPTAGLHTAALEGPWRQLEFDFRTGQPDIDHIVSGWDPEDGGLQMKISLKGGYRIELSLQHHQPPDLTEKEAEKKQNDGAPEKRGIRRELSVSVASPRPLNDLHWHRVLVEVFRAEIRFSIDRLNAFQALTFPFATSTKFAIGGDERGNGFVGCLGNFQVNRVLVDWREQLAQKEKDQDVRVVAGCADLCHDHQCQQGSRCIEHFDTETTSCECKLPHIHYGEHCEKNVNTNSSVHFPGGQSAILRFAQLASSALHADLVFSMRTDQRRALLMYEHDQADNFVQIHLADEHRIVLTLNNLSSIVSCTVFAPAGKTFNNLSSWLQVVLERNEHGPGTVRLHVDDEHCQLGPILLNNPMAQEEVGAVQQDEEEEEEFGDAILPPAPAFPSSPNQPPQPFHVMFVGGVPRARRSFAKRQKRSREARLPVYVSNLPSLKGCIRGMIVDGEKVDLREAMAKKSGSDRVNSCDQIPCDQLHCQNGGQCSVIEWSDRNWPPRTRCSCGHSTFGGPNCTEDLAMTFSGHASLLFDMAEPRRFGFLQDSDRQSLNLAFSATKIGERQQRPQHLVSVEFEDGREFHVVLNIDGSLLVAFLGPDGHQIGVQRISGNFRDGYRHRFRANFLRNTIELYGDDRFSTFRVRDLSLATARSFHFGGGKSEENSSSILESVEHSGSSEEAEETLPLELEVEKPGELTVAAEAASSNSTTRNTTATEGHAAIEAEPATGAEEPILFADAMREILAKRLRKDKETATEGKTASEGKLATEGKVTSEGKATGQGETASEGEAATEGGAAIETDSIREILTRRLRKDKKPATEGEAATDDDENAATEGKAASEADAIREILTRRLRKENPDPEWPKRKPERFRGCIANIRVEFERDGRVLAFMPLQYFLHAGELLHRSVSAQPAGAHLASAETCGRFRPIESAKKPPRAVQFPVWEAPLRAIPFSDSPAAADQPMAGADQINSRIRQISNREGGQEIWAWPWRAWVLIALILLLLLVLLISISAFWWWPRIRRRWIGRSYVLRKQEQKQPMLNNRSSSRSKRVIENGPKRRSRHDSLSALDQLHMTQHRFFPLQGSFCGTDPIPLPTPPQKANNAGGSTPRGNCQAQIAKRKAPSRTSSTSSLYFTAQEQWPASMMSSYTSALENGFNNHRCPLEALIPSYDAEIKR